MSTIYAKYRRCLPSFARPGSMRSVGFAIQRICATPIPVFSGRRLNLISETLWTICELPRKVSSGSPTFMLTCSQRNIAEPSELVEPFLQGDLAKAALPGQFSKLCAHAQHVELMAKNQDCDDELAPVAHSITSSARASNVGGTLRPSALAVFRLITSSYFTGACTGRSAGFSPRRMRST